MSFYKNLAYISKGLTEYTSSGFTRASKKFNPKDLDIECHGKVFLITGANRGLGKHVAHELAKRGGTVHLICRDEEKAEEVKKDLTTATNNKSIHIHIVDMAEPEQVYKFAKEFSETQPSLNVVIHNAGVLNHVKKVNSQGMEPHFALLTLGVHILTTLLTPLLNKSLEPRVIIVSSSGMIFEKLNVDDLNLNRVVPYDGLKAFYQNKRRQVVLVDRYSEIYPGIHFSCMHPGWVNTLDAREANLDFYNTHYNKLRSIEQGADTIIWLAVSRAAIKESSGLFFQDRKPVATHWPFFGTKIQYFLEEEFIEILDRLMKNYNN